MRTDGDLGVLVEEWSAELEESERDLGGDGQRRRVALTKDVVMDLARKVRKSGGRESRVPSWIHVDCGGLKVSETSRRELTVGGYFEAERMELAEADPSLPPTRQASSVFTQITADGSLVLLSVTTIS